MRRPEDELAKMVRGRNPMMPPPPPPEEGMPPGAPPEMGMEMGMDMPPEMPPDMGMDEEMAPPDAAEPELPKSATVQSIEGGTVVLKSDTGKTHKVPIGDFPIPPQEGMQMVQAIVGEIRDGMMVALVGADQTEIELPLDGMESTFNEGDYFWMPAPPSGPPQDAMPEMPGMPPMDEELL